MIPNVFLKLLGASLVETGKITCQDAYSSFQSWRACAGNFDAYRTIRNMNRLHDELNIKNWAPCSGGVRQLCPDVPDPENATALRMRLPS